jgi:predicted  nucleic acid-binding Zn-ribbon protein
LAHFSCILTQDAALALHVGEKMNEYVRSQLEFLRELSDLDSRVSELQAKMKEKETSFSQLKEKLSKNKEEYAKCTSQLKVSEHAEHSEEVQLKEAEAELKKTQILLNSAQRNEEYSILLKKRDSIRSQISALEDAALARLAEIDSARTRLAELTEEISREENEVKAAEEQKEKEMGALQNEADKLLSRREELKTKISSEIFTRYERVLNKEKRRVVVCIKNGICQGCYRTITPEQINTIMRGESLIFCRNCNRILYLEEPEQESSPDKGGPAPDSSK